MYSNSQTMTKVYHLKTCNTCARIIKELNVPQNIIFQDIKTEEITANQLDELHKISGSYEALFSKRAKLYKEMGLKNEALNEQDYRRYILEHYTFLKRPVVIHNDQVFIGNSKKTVEMAKKAINEK